MLLLVAIFCVATAILIALINLNKPCHSRRRSRPHLPPDQLLCLLEFLPRTDIDVCQITSRLLNEILRRNWKNFKRVKRVFTEIRLENVWLDSIAQYRINNGLSMLVEFGARKTYTHAAYKNYRQAEFMDESQMKEHVLVALFYVDGHQVFARFYRGCNWNQWRKLLCSINGTVVKRLSAVGYKRHTHAYCCAILRWRSPTVDFILHRYREDNAYRVDFQAIHLEFNNRGEYEAWRRLVKKLGCTNDDGSESDGKGRKVFHLRMSKPQA